MKILKKKQSTIIWPLLLLLDRKIYLSCLFCLICWLIRLSPEPLMYPNPEESVVKAVNHWRYSNSTNNGNPVVKWQRVEPSRKNWVAVLTLLRVVGSTMKVTELEELSKIAFPFGFSRSRITKEHPTRATSRKMMRAHSGSGIKPLRVRPTVSDPITTLSANGSRNAPRTVFWL